MNLYPISLRNKLLFFSAMLVLIPGLVLGVLVERSSRASLESLIGQRLSREANHAARRLSALAEAELELLTDFARQPVMREIAVLDLDKNIARALRALRAGNSARVGYLLMGVDGLPIASDDPRLLAEPPGWAGRAVDRARVLGLESGLASSDRILLGAPVRDPDRPHERIGTLYALIDGALLTDVTESIRAELESQSISARIFVSDDEGHLLQPAPEQGRADEPTAKQVERWIRFEGVSGFAVDADWIVGRAHLTEPVRGWRVLFVEPLGQALAPVGALQRRIMLIVVVALALALFVAALSADRVIRPLRELTGAIRGLARAEDAVRSVAVRSNDEVGTLARAFNEMARELDEAQRHLVEAEKFAFVGELAAGVAHRVRTSLGVLSSSAQLLQRAYPESADPASREMLDMITAEVKRLGRVVDDLLTLEKGRSLVFEPIEIAVPLRAAVAFLEPQAREKSISIRVDPGVDGRWVSCDREAIEQVFVNLIANAVASLERGSTIEIFLTRLEHGTDAISIRDDGAGIAPEIADRLFDPFVTGRVGGVGLGLTFVKRIVHAHQWTIELVPHDAPGAWFRIVLPQPRRDE